MPVPAAVIARALQALRGGDGDDAAAGSRLHSSGAAPDAFIAVEVETRQGYVYSGKLLDIDGEYNMTLRDATVRRERLCDVARAVRRQQRQTLIAQLGSLAPRELVSGELDGDRGERVGAATRPRYLGSVLIRSSNLLMARFPTPSLPVPAPPAGEGEGEGEEEGAEKKKKRSRGKDDPRDLRAAFRSAAVAVKRGLQVERRKNREARRKRLANVK